MVAVVTDQAYIDDRPTLPLTFHHENGTVENIGTAIYNKDGTVDVQMRESHELSLEVKRIFVLARDFVCYIGQPWDGKTELELLPVMEDS